MFTDPVFAYHLFVSLLPEDKQAEAKAIVAAYETARNDLAKITATVVPVWVKDRFKTDPVPTPKPQPKPDRRGRITFLSLTSLQVYDILVGLGSDQAAVPVEDLNELLATHGGTQDSSEKSQRRLKVGQAVKTLVKHGLASATARAVQHVPGVKVPYESLGVPAAVAVRLHRLGRPATMDELGRTIELSWNKSRSKKTYVLSLIELAVIPGLERTGERYHQTLTQTSPLFTSDPPVILLPDEPGYVIPA